MTEIQMLDNAPSLGVRELPPDPFRQLTMRVPPDAAANRTMCPPNVAQCPGCTQLATRAIHLHDFNFECLKNCYKVP